MKILQPYDYQEESVNQLAYKIKDGYKKILMQQVTGAGKTVIASYFLKRYYSRNPSAKCIFLTHREEICEQAVRTFRGYGINCRVEMVKTFINQLKIEPQHMDFLICDEVHHGDFMPIYKFYQDSFILGITATPIASNKKFPLKGVYETIITGLQPYEIVNKGFLCKLIHYTPETDLDTKEFKRGSSISDKRMGEAYSKPKLVEGVLHQYQKLCQNDKTVIFNTTKEHCRLVHECFLKAGLPSFLLLSNDMSKRERKEILSAYEACPNGILQNVAIATAGYDHPPIVNAILNFTSDSLVKYLQSAGRVARIFPGKKEGRVIDLGGNAAIFGRWDAHRDWKEMFYNPGRLGEGVAPMKECPECEALIFMSSRQCEFCGHKMPIEIVYSDMIVELKLMPDKEIVRNSHSSLEKGISASCDKIRKLAIPIEEKRELLAETVKLIYSKNNWDLKPSKLKLIIKSEL